MRLFPHAVSVAFTDQHRVNITKLRAQMVRPWFWRHTSAHGNAAEVRADRSQLRQRQRLGALSTKSVFKICWRWGSCGLSFLSTLHKDYQWCKTALLLPFPVHCLCHAHGAWMTQKLLCWLYALARSQVAGYTYPWGSAGSAPVKLSHCKN